MILASLAFVILPRPTNARMQQLLASTGLTRFQLSMRNFSGLADQVELGYLSPIRKNSARVMRVSIEGAGETPPPPYIRVRGGAFDLFDGRRWNKSHPEFTYRLAERTIETRHARAWMRRERGVVYGPTYDPGKPLRTEEYVLNPLMNTNLVFTVGAPATIETTFPGVYFDFTDTVYFPNAYPEGLRYRIRTQETEPNLSRAIEGYDEFLRTAYLDLPEKDDRLFTLAEQLTSGVSGSAAKAQALENRLRSGYSYSLAAAHGRQDVGGFLFDSKAGNCEYFATAMCLLLRHLGIPSRLAVGFLSDEWNAYGKFFDVRQSDAHAWVEAYLPNRGWTTFDPTPADLSLGGADSFLTRIWGGLAQTFEALQFRWYRYVVGYDTFTQRNFFYTLLLKIGASIVPLLIGAVLIAAAAALLLVKKPWRRIRARRGRRGASDDFFGVILPRLARAGFPRRPAQTAAEYAEAVGRDHPELQPLSGLAARHYEARYAGRPLSSAEENDVRRSSDEIVAAARRLKKHRNRGQRPA
jgi:transglutaminase-like putative cysteine protease